MGVFDFVRNAGAKIGIGKSTDEIEAEEAAAAAAEEEKAKAIEAAKAAAAAAIRTRQANEAKAARDTAEANKAKEAAEARRAKFKARAAERRKAAGMRKFEAYKKSNEIEAYVRALGLDDDNELDVRFEDGTAYIEGVVPDQETREKVILAVGNAEGVARVNEEIEVVEPEPEAVFHTVESGDTLWAIAEKVYGDGNRYPEIFEANQPMLTDPDLIFPGQVLRCPQ